MYQVLENCTRPSAELVDQFRACGASNVTDAMGRYGSMRSQMKPVWRGARVVGPAITVLPFKADNLMVHLAIDRLSRPGDVLVIDAAGYPDAALIGELICLSCKAKGIAGIVIDGGARDVEAIEDLRYPVFATGVLPGGTFKNSPGSINVPIACAGVAVRPGDMVVADRDGVVIVPLEQCEAILKASLAITQREEAIRKRIASGETVYQILDLQKVVDDLGLKVSKREG